MPGPSDAVPAQVLVVDDDRINRMLLTRSLESEGHVVRTAANGREALDILHREPPDVVLLDIVMPELDGVSVLKQLKADETLAHLPVIVISGYPDLAERIKSANLGNVVKLVLMKPVDPDFLLRRPKRPRWNSPMRTLPPPM